jgi:hypothetical protein
LRATSPPSNKCPIKKDSGSTKRARTSNGDNSNYPFNKSIPATIHNEINDVVRLTQDTGKEQSLTLCRIRGTDRVFISSYARGSTMGASINPCAIEHGNTEQIGDLHTHPTQNENIVGITPSTSDIVSTVLDSNRIKIPQISCITGPDAKYISCYQPTLPLLADRSRIQGYKDAAQYHEKDVTSFSPYLREHAAHDFHHAWYNRKNFKRTTPTPKEIIKDAFLNSKSGLKFENIPDMDKGPFCDIIQDLNYPTSKNDNVALECRRALKVRDIFGFRF